MTCDVFNTVWVEVLLAFPTELFEVNLEHDMKCYMLWPSQFLNTGHIYDTIKWTLVSPQDENVPIVSVQDSDKIVSSLQC